MSIAKKVEDITEAVVQLRRFLHENAELGMKEFVSTKRIVEELKKLPGMEVQDMAPGCVGILHGKKPGKTLALRADMDALPSQEESGLPFASKNDGIAHTCGHDMHTAILMGCAMVLSTMTDTFDGTIKFFFQPSEETLEGAKHLIKNGAMENPKVDAIFALHMWPNGQAGTIALKSGPVNAASDAIDITVTGRAGHAAYPHRSVDAIFMAGHIITALQGIVARQLDALDSAVISLGSIHGGTVRNIIAPEVTMSGTVRTLSPEVREKIPGQIERIVTQVAEAFGGTATVNYIKRTPALINNDAMAELIRTTATHVIGEENITNIPVPSMGGEDFSYYLEHAPGAMFRLGSAGAEPNSQLVLHNQKIIFNEEAIPVGMNMLCQTAITYLNQ